ncbi:Adenylate cyclase, class 3 [Saccharicrinis carchari]|uniref:Adenylate cyclase, class 3 n=1 Tax=Saccharicrinis carchari TaxID=1168039 RepID=A0A521DRV1_SACCC|nr:adenylate/guanylate cyclase domain-containing protein [Saccharicrinis carchari]SMO74434.1 Adenylate cyclase, class 3 [Saccharicrinis carchari]
MYEIESKNDENSKKEYYSMDTGKILLIGKDYCNLELLEHQLMSFSEEWRIKVKLFHDSVYELNNTHHDLVIIDFGGSPEKLLKKIEIVKKSHQNHNTPILVCFVEKSAKLIKTMLEAGALDFIQKPFKPIELFARVRTALILSSTVKKLNHQADVIRESQNKVNEIISGLLPKKIIDELTVSGESRPKKYREASVLFVDLVDFTKKSTTLAPKILIDELTQIFNAFDSIIKKNGCTRIKTMGDGYLAVSGIPTPHKQHAVKLIQTAIDMRAYLSQRNESNAVKWELKIGIDSGEVIGSILGTNNFLFDIFGDTVNTAARMEKTCAPNQINIGMRTYLSTRDKFRYIERLPNDVKGLGVKNMYYLKSKINSSHLNRWQQ